MTGDHQHATAYNKAAACWRALLLTTPRGLSRTTHGLLPSAGTSITALAPAEAAQQFCSKALTCMGCPASDHQGEYVCCQRQKACTFKRVDHGLCMPGYCARRTCGVVQRPVQLAGGDDLAG